MTSDSSNAKQLSMARVQSPSPHDGPIVLATTNGSDLPQSALLPLDPPASAVGLPPKHMCDERTRFLPLTYKIRSPTSSYSTSPGPNDNDRVYQWNDYQSTSNTESNVAHQYVEAQVMSEPPRRRQDPPDQTRTSAFTKLLVTAQSLSTSLPSSSSGFNIVGASGRSLRDQRRRHSILRVSSNKSMIDKPLKKSTSVEFALHSEAMQKLLQDEKRETASNPRRLTFEEREELYKIRPDLEVGPTPYFKEQMQELEKRNQRRMLFAILGGVMCLMSLMVVYYVLSIAT